MMLVDMWRRVRRKSLLAILLALNPAAGFHPYGAGSKLTAVTHVTRACHHVWSGAADTKLPELEGSVLVLGAGWVGSRLAAHLSTERVEVSVTNRPDWDSRRKAPYFAPIPLDDFPIERHAFDIADNNTWAGLPDPSKVGAVVLTFEVKVLQDMAAFWDAYLSRVSRVIAYSTTSVYRVEFPGQLVDERTPLGEFPRAEVEQYLQQRGATILTVSGIFGEPGGTRDLCACLAAFSKYGGELNGQKMVNMVHVDDIIAATVHSLAAEKAAATRYNVAGLHFRLHRLLRYCNHPKADEAEAILVDTDPFSKIVSSEKLLNELLPPGFSFLPAMERDASITGTPRL